LDAIKSLIYAAVVNGLVAPVILALIVILSSNKKIMGERINHPFMTTAGWVTTGLMTFVSIGTIFSLF